MQEQEQVRFSVSDSFSMAREVFDNHAILFVAIYFVCGLPQTIVSGLLGDSVGAGAIGFVLTMIGYSVADPAVTWATFTKLENANASLEGTVEHGLDFFWPVFVAGLIAGVVFLIGLVALIVPGLIILSLVFFAVPAIVSEKCGAIESLERSFSMGRGIRGEVFLLVFIFLALEVLIVFLPGLLLGKLPYVGALVILVLNSGVSAFGSVLAAVAFRQIKMTRGMAMGVGQT